MMSQRSGLRLLTLVSLVIGSSALAGPLHDAAEQGSLHEVRQLLTQGTNVNAKDQHGATPLHLAIRWGHEDVVTLLLTQGADVNAKDQQGVTPLHWAAYFGRRAVVEWLLAEGAEVEVKNRKGYTPRDWAAEKGHQDIVALLKQHAGASSTHSAALRSFWKPDGITINPANEARIRKWLVEHGINEPSMTVFLHAPGFAGARQQLAEELRLETIRNLQTMLKAMGYYRGQIDGIAGPGTMAAIQALQRQGQGPRIAPKPETRPVASPNTAVLMRLLAQDALRSFWKPDDTTVNPANEMRLRRWLADHNIQEPSLTFFLHSDTYTTARQQLAEDLGLLAWPPASDTLRQFWKPDGTTINPVNEMRLRRWLADHNIQEPSLTFFLHSDTYTTARQQLVQELGLEVRNLQARLQALRYYRGQIDGVIGPGTLAAVEKFLQDGGHFPTLLGHATRVNTLHEAIRQGRSAPQVAHLLARGADVNTQDDEGLTPLHWAAKEGNQDIVKLLIAWGADVRVKSRKGLTPLDWAAEQGHQDIVALLKQHGG
jgi:cytohesin